MSSNSELKKMAINYCSNKKSLEGTGTAQGKIVIDGKEIEFLNGDTIMHAAERAGVAKQIPRYCYHPGLSIAGSCRMCTVEVEKAPKLMTACSTPAVNGMVVSTQSEKVIKSRNGVMEFLLTNHPLDCPVCDQAGECELQEYNYEYGPGSSRFTEEKRIFPDSTTQNLSDKITLNMNRCINCERCVRFEDEVTHTNDLLMDNRAWKKQLVVTDEEKGLTSNYQGCLADICPVGALTFRDFRFRKRVWFLEKRASICDGCSKGCNISVHSEKGIIYRYLPRYNERVNQHWICDEGRLGYQRRQSAERVVNPTYPWKESLQKLQLALHGAKNILLVMGTDATQEEALLLKEGIPLLCRTKEITSCYYNGVNEVFSSTDDQKLDHLLRMKDKTSNTRGLELLGLSRLTKEIEQMSFDLALFFKNGQSAVPKNVTHCKQIFLWGVWSAKEVASLSNVTAVLPGPVTSEKSGTYINCDQIPQTFSPAVDRLGNILTVDEIISYLKEVEKNG